MSLTPSAWRLEEDRRQLAPPPVAVTCDRCGARYRLDEDDEGEEERVCLRCAAGPSTKNARRCANTDGRDIGLGGPDCND